MRLSKRQKAYREYLKSEHWEALRESALVRDGRKCVLCSSTDRLQVHHKVYRGRLEEGLLEDLETLCRKHHRLEHGFGPTDFEAKAREIGLMFRYQKMPVPADWKELMALRTDYYDEVLIFAELMFDYVYHGCAARHEGYETDWWMDEARRDYWFHRAFRVRESIQKRVPEYVR